jgi:hypothetical protein
LAKRASFFRGSPSIKPFDLDVVLYEPFVIRDVRLAILKKRFGLVYESSSIMYAIRVILPSFFAFLSSVFFA